MTIEELTNDEAMGSENLEITFCSVVILKN